MMLENYVLDIMEGRRKGRSFLEALSYLYRGGVTLRNLAYDKKILPAEDAKIPVVSIGNIVAGGTGKTPLVKFLAEELLKDLNVAILSRGYRSVAEKKGKNFQVKPDTAVTECGDEPFWLASKLPKAQVWVGKNRCISACQARQNGAEVIILDDGMQHRQLKRDFEIVVVDGVDPLGKGYFLPRGLLRDSPQRLKNADLVVVMEPQEGFDFSSYTKAPIVSIGRRPETSLTGKKVAVFCAIGKPERFLKTVQEAGGEIVASLFKPDHDPFTREEIEQFREKTSADLLVCTEKDQVKLPSHDLPITALVSRLEISSGQEAWQQLVKNIQSKVAS